MTILRLASSGCALVAALALAACSKDKGTASTTTTGTGGTSSSTGSSAQTGTGGTGGAGGTFEVAPHAAAPQVISLGGTPLKKPKVQLIRYATDPHATDLDAFLQELSQTSYWSETTSEYGVGPLTVLPTIIRTEAAPTSITDATVQSELAANTTGTSPAWGAADPSTIYFFVFPPGSIVDDDGDCCQDFDGYHDEATVGSGSVPYAIACACGGAFDGPGVSDMQQLTIVGSHELIEASTDPYVRSNPAYGQTDDADAIWTLATGGEVADMCEFDPDAFVVPTGSTYEVQRSWSNAAAKAGNDPCVPAPSTDPYFGATPVMSDMLKIKGVPFDTTGVKLAVGATTTIPVQLYSAAPTSGPFKVSAVDFSYFIGGNPNLQLTLDKETGSNGDTLQLTIKALSTDTTVGADAFFLVSQLGSQSSLAMGVVGAN